MKKTNSEIQKYSFAEKKSTLTSRIEAHNKYSKLEINDWILNIIKIRKGEKILDVGCGTGKQTIPYKKLVGDKGQVTGTDISEELIEEAKKNAHTANLKIDFIVHNADNSFNFPDNYFDLITSCFSIYYLKNLEQSILELKRMLQPGGRIFLAGPTPENAKLLHNLHQKVTQKPLPYMPGISRFMTEILNLIQKYFKQVKIYHFQNPLIFKDTDSFLDYYSSTGLFLENIKGDIEKNNIKEKMKEEIQHLIQEKGEVEIAKDVGGILAYKEKGG